MGELVNGWWNLESHHEDGLLSLNADVLGPLLEERGASILSLLVADDNLTLGSFLNLI